jgi:hypothetical protein
LDFALFISPAFIEIYAASNSAISLYSLESTGFFSMADAVYLLESAIIEFLLPLKVFNALASCFFAAWEKV